MQQLSTSKQADSTKGNTKDQIKPKTFGFFGIVVMIALWVIGLYLKGYMRTFMGRTYYGKDKRNNYR